MTTTRYPELDATYDEVGDAYPDPDPAGDGGASRGGRRGWVMRRALLAADLTGLTLAFLVAWRLFPPPGSTDAIGPGSELLLFALTLPAWAILFNASRLYDGDRDSANRSAADDLIGVFHVVTTGAFMVWVAGWLTGWFQPSPPKLITFWLVAIVAVTAARAVARSLVRRRPSYLQRTVIVGAGDVGQRVAEKILRHPEYGLDILGFLDGRPRERRETVDDLTILGTVGDLEEVVRRHRVDRVVVAFSDDGQHVSLDTIRRLGDEDVKVDVVPRFFEVLGPTSLAHEVEGLPLRALPRLKLSRSAALAKRGLDVTVATVALVLLSPLLALMAAAIKLDSRGPVLFRQTRMGAGGTPFRILKFRTMRVDAEERKQDFEALNKHLSPGGDPRMFKVAGDPRVTRVGRVLRRFSLDELPQLWNVLRGEMSLVGPRPLIPEEDAYVVDWRRRRLHVKPGITGLWQVLGRDDIPFEEMAILDCSYVTGWSLVGDVQLMVRTIPAMVRRRSAY